ncbi:MAG: Crp/Fnr family transcriptional regulator [Vampirovibrio sp.]|jgi:uncharacterized membrane protein YphA (DoxX/SURF4 family)|nr:Crp/Fnr family transcriptional regulator [Vampirovibrio sp.]
MRQAFGKFWQRISQGPRDKQALAFLRVTTGLFFLYAGNQKLSTPHFETALSGILKTWAAGNPFPIYKQFLEHVALPNVHYISLLVTDGEMAVGLSYILGILVQFSAPAAVFMNVNFLLAAQHTDPSVLTMNLVFIIISLTLFWGRAGKHYGMDGLIASKPAKGQKAELGKSSKKLKATHDLLENAQKGKGKNKPKSKPF